MKQEKKEEEREREKTKSEASTKMKKGMKKQKYPVNQSTLQMLFKCCAVHSS